jgi:hypothetical protein
MKKSPFTNALRKAEGTIAAVAGGRKSWDSVTLKETALSAMAAGFFVVFKSAKNKLENNA